MIFFQPRSPPGDLHRDLAPPRLDSAFYTDLGARAIAAVESMKKVRMMMMMMMMMVVMIRTRMTGYPPTSAKPTNVVELSGSVVELHL